MSAGAVHAPSLERVATWAPVPVTRVEETTDATELSDSSGVHASSASASSHQEETEESSNGAIASSTSETAESSSFDWTESHSPETLAPAATSSPTATAPASTPKPAASVATNTTTKSGGGSSTTIGISLALVAVILILCVVYILYRRRKNRRNIRNKFFNPDLNAPTISIELPPPPPSSHLSGSQLNQSRLSVFSGTRSGGDSLFNTAAPVVSPHGRVHQNGRAVLGASTGAPFRPDQSMTYRLVDPSPSHSTPPDDVAHMPNPAYTTFALTAASVGQAASPAPRSFQPDYGHPHMTDYGSPHHRKTSNAQRKISTATNVTTTSSASFSSETSSPMSIGTMASSAMSIRTSGASETSTLNGLHDSMCEDVYQYGDGLGRERAASRGRGVSSASASTSASARGPSTVLEIDELVPAPVPVLPKTPTSAKTISFAAMRGKRAPPPPPPPPPSSSSSSQPLPEVEPFDPLLMTSVKVHKLRASEDDSGHGVVVASAFADSSSNAPFTASHLLSSHNGRIFEKPTDDGIQRLSDVSSVYSDSSSVRAGSLIELKQVTGLVENVDGVANEIEI